jgi:hypothetical protein
MGMIPVLYIRSDTVIVVSGEMRSGTSMMMLMIKKLGFSIAGFEQITEQGPQMNPTGIWEIKGVAMGPFDQSVIDKHNITEDVVKIISHGLFYSDMSLFDKIVWCVRDPREIVVSQRKQTNYRGDEHNYKWYNVHTAALVTFMEKGKMPPTLFVNYKDMIKKPRKQCRRVADFLGVPYKKSATSHISSRHYRSKAKDADYDETAMRYYNYLKQLCV